MQQTKGNKDKDDRLGGGLQTVVKSTMQNQEKLDLMRVLRFLILLEPREIFVNDHM